MRASPLPFCELGWVTLCQGCQREGAGTHHLDVEPPTLGAQPHGTSSLGHSAGPPSPSPAWVPPGSAGGGGGWWVEAGSATGQSLIRALSDSLFAQCHSLAPPEHYYEACRFDSCFVPNSGMECASLQTYAALCAQEGVCIDWRNHTHGACRKCLRAPALGCVS